MGEILQVSECYILQWWDEYYGRWNESRFCSYGEAMKTKDQFTAGDMRWGRKTQCRIVKETTIQEVIYDD